MATSPYPPLELPPPGVEPVWWPINAAQQAALNCKAELLLMGGQSGGGKTQFLAADAMQEYKNPRLSALLIRTTLQEMQELEDIQQRMYEPYGARWQKKMWKFPSGARIQPGYLAHDKHLNRYQGNPRTWIGVDESGQHPEHRVRYMLSWLVAPNNSGLRARARFTSNPGGIGHGWQMKVFLRNRCPVHAPADFADDRPYETSVWPGRVYRGACWTDDSPVHKTTAFIPARLADNPLYGPEKLASLLSQSKAVQQQLLYGCWCNAAGLYFDFMRPDMVVPYATIGDSWWWQHFLSIDYGYGNSSAAGGMYAINPSGRVFKTRERVERKMPALKFAQAICKDGFPQTDFPSQRPQQSWLKKLKPRDPERPRMSFCVMDEAMDQHRGTGKSIYDVMAEAFAANGIGSIKAAHDPAGNAQVLYNGLANTGLVLTRDSADLPLSYRAISSRIVDDRKAIKKIHGAWEDDVYDECLAKGTLISTERGAVPIEEVCVRDRVWTRDGLKDVTWSGRTQANAVMSTVVFSDGRTLTGTANHPVWVNGKGFISLDKLTHGDNVFLWRPQVEESKQLSIGGLPSEGTPTPRNRTTGTISAQVGQIAIKAWKTCIARFTETISALYRTGTKSITKMETLPTTHQRTTNYSQSAGTASITGRGESLSPGRWTGRADTSPPSVPLRLPGTDHQKEGAGTPSISSRSLKTVHPRRSLASNAAVDSRPSVVGGIGFAPPSVKQSSAETQGWMTSISHALSVLRYSGRIASTAESSARVSVQRLITGGCGEVYNLSVADCPEFFANGVLVHNCAYAFNTWRQNSEKPARTALADELAQMRKDGVDETSLGRIAWSREMKIQEDERRASKGIRLGRDLAPPGKT